MEKKYPWMFWEPIPLEAQFAVQASDLPWNAGRVDFYRWSDSISTESRKTPRGDWISARLADVTHFLTAEEALELGTQLCDAAKKSLGWRCSSPACADLTLLQGEAFCWKCGSRRK